MNNTKQNIQFNVIASTRDKEAAKHFASKEFFELAKNICMERIIKDGQTSAIFRGDFAAKKHDQVYLDQILPKLKAEFPEINHLRICEGSIILDTKPNTFLRRYWSGLGYSAW